MALIYNFGGHTYQIITTARTWSAASTQAQSVGAHLATISSLAEQEAILSNYFASLSVGTQASDGGNGFYVWLGGTDALVEGDWIWVDGSNFSSFTNWGSGLLGTEPDNALGVQDALAMSLTVWPYPNGGIGTAGKWNDLNATNLLYSVIEWDSDITVPAAPKLVTTSSFVFSVNPQITIQTTMGTIVVQLNPTAAPITVANMLAYADQSFYDGTLFHRVIPNFMAQGGGFTSGMNQKSPTYGPIVLESANGLLNTRGTIAMARTSEANSATSQFFINQVDNAFLNYTNAANPGYAVFGQVLSGLSVIDAMVQVATTTVNGNQNVPVANVVINSLQQTTAGSAITNNGSMAISALELGATWSYTLNGGLAWNAGSGTSLLIPDGTYAANSIQVRQTDTGGNTSTTTGKFGSAVIVDSIAPTVANFSPSDGLTGVALDSNIVLSFTEAIFRGAGTIILRNATSNAVIESYNAASSSQLTFLGNTLTINPSSDLSSSTTYKVEFASGNVKDIAGNFYAGTTNYDFTTLAVGVTVNLLAYSWKAHTLLDGVAINATASATGFQGNTNVSGLLSLNNVVGSEITVTPQRLISAGEISASNQAVNLQDAIAILKLIVGLEVNATPNSLSPYQSLAADFDSNGVVNLNDAIGVLKHVVGLAAPVPQWVFANEADLSMPARAGLNPGVLSGTFNASIGTPHVGLVGILRGDVDGSYSGGGSTDLDVSQPNYFANLLQTTQLSPTQFGIYA
jgi:cyclophilin family peptidyl-prolyl cis-trans isomerase